MNKRIWEKKNIEMFTRKNCENRNHLHRAYSTFNLNSKTMRRSCQSSITFCGVKIPNRKANHKIYHQTIHGKATETAILTIVIINYTVTYIWGCPSLCCRRYSGTISVCPTCGLYGNLAVRTLVTDSRRERVI